MWFISVSRFSFLYRLYPPWFSRLNDFTLIIFGALYSLLFGVMQGSVLKTVPSPIMIYFYKFWLGWRVVSIGTHTTCSYIYLLHLSEIILVVFCKRHKYHLALTTKYAYSKFLFWGESTWYCCGFSSAFKPIFTDVYTD